MNPPGPEPLVDEQELLRTFLQERDALCPVCAYNLRNLTSGTCPECGQRVALRVAAPELRLGAFVWALAPLLMMAGTACFTLLVVIMEGPPPGATWGLWGLFALAAVDLSLAGVLYRNRVAFFRRSRARQVQTAALLWALHLVLMLVFSLDLF